MLLNNALNSGSGLYRKPQSTVSNVVLLRRNQSRRTMRAENIEPRNLTFIDDRLPHPDAARKPLKRWLGLVVAWTGFAALLRIAIGIPERRRQRSAFLELYALDDRTLNDIGISRCEIHHRVYGRRLR